jgi:autophagy-related protein 101
MEQLVTEKVDIFWKGIESGANKRGQVSFYVYRGYSPFISFFIQIIVTFSEKKAKKSWFQVYIGEEEVPWEQWCVLWWFLLGSAADVCVCV